MVEKDVEMFLEACELKGLSMKTIGSYEQTLRLFMQHLYKIGIERTENVTHLTIQGYIQEIRRRGKYTAVTNQDARNYPENRPDYGKQVSDVTINNYLRNLRVFFNWCVDEEKLHDDCMEKLNRTLDGPYGIPIDIIVGTFLIVGLTEDDFGELLPEFVEKYEKMFHQPRKFVTYTDSEGKAHLDVDYCTPEE